MVEHQTGIPQEAPLHDIHKQTASTGIRDLADQHDHYLYGVEEHSSGNQEEAIALRLEPDAQEPERLLHLLLAAPTLSEDELEEFAQVREWMDPPLESSLHSST